MAFIVGLGGNAATDVELILPMNGVTSVCVWLILVKVSRVCIGVLELLNNRFGDVAPKCTMDN